MSINTLKCTSCGASVEYTGEACIVCPYCGTELHFGEVEEKAELEDLRKKKFRKGFKTVNNKSMKKWVKEKRLTFAEIGIVNTIAAILICCGYEAGAYIMIFVLAWCFIGPPYHALSYPCFDDEKGEAVYSRKKIFSQMLFLFLQGMAVFIVSFSVVLLIAALLTL